MSSTPEESEFEIRAHIGAIWSGGRLFIGIYTFVITSLVFSYFYLRSSNNGELWRPKNVTAPTQFGWSIYTLTLMAALLAIFGQKRLKKGSFADWQVAGWTGVLACIVAVLLQSWEFAVLPFYPGSSGYASTFIGFSVMNIMTILISLYWLETGLARGLRLKRELGVGANIATSPLPSARCFRANVSSMTYFMGFVGLVSTLLFAMFYLL
jgi:heme/copper-type cytochrome/quinol oxidase subunit 3